MDTVPQFVRLTSPQSSHSNSVQLQKSQPVCQVIVVIICGHGVYTVEWGEEGVVGESMHCRLRELAALIQIV